MAVLHRFYCVFIKMKKDTLEQFKIFIGFILDVWKVKSDNIQCIHLCFCMLAISFYFVNCVIISCKLSFNSRFTRNQIPIMSFLGFKKAELGCKMSELHLYVVKRQNWVVIIRK